MSNSGLLGHKYLKSGPYFSTLHEHNMVFMFQGNFFFINLDLYY